MNVSLFSTYTGCEKFICGLVFIRKKNYLWVINDIGSPFICYKIAKKICISPVNVKQNIIYQVLSSEHYFIINNMYWPTQFTAKDYSTLQFFDEYGIPIDTLGIPNWSQLGSD